MALKMKWHLKCIFTQNGRSLKIEYHSKFECHSPVNVTQNGMSLNMECHFKWYVPQNEISLKIECHLKWNVIQNGM